MKIDQLGHGQVWWADLDKIRPVVVLTRRSVAPLLTRVLVAPVTTQVRGLVSEVAVGSTEGVHEGSVASLDNAQLVPVELLVSQAGQVSTRRWPEFCRAMAKSMACPG